MSVEATTKKAQGSSCIVRCATCGIPGRVVFDGDEIRDAFFVCKCPRPTVEDANAAIKASVGDDA